MNQRLSSLSRLALGAFAAAIVTISPARAGMVPQITFVVTTDKPPALQAFRRGLLDYYAYNVEAAQQEFSTAARLDPHLAMAYWGVAMSDAPNLNVPPTDAREAQAVLALKRARGVEGYASPRERAYIDAATTRFSTAKPRNDAKLEAIYTLAMRAVAATYPTDPDALTLYGEALLYTDDRSPEYQANLEAADRAFAAALALDPLAVGALHFTIHTDEMLHRPQDALVAARTLAAFDFPMQNSHLSHMPGHIFASLGLYDEDAVCTLKSVQQDDEWIAAAHPGFYDSGPYYRRHNIAYAVYALTQLQRGGEAVALARRENDVPQQAATLVAQQRWNDVLALRPAVGERGARFDRAIALAQTGKVWQARRELAALARDPGSNVRAARIDAVYGAGLIAVVDGKDAVARALLQQSIAAVDAYDSEIPILWEYPPRIALAQMLAANGDPERAFALYREELVKMPNAPAALRGLEGLGARAKHP
ncbi:MAG TPA: hypothetical protein VIJ12_11295 [Candidatus Baltobacteraceae bacterium]